MVLFLHCTEYCQGGQVDDSVCNYNATTDNTSSCVSATLQCENMMCSAVISNYSRTCHFMNIGDTISQPIQCCYCNDSNSLIPNPWWDCEYIIIPSPSLTSTKSYSTNGESLTIFLEYWGELSVLHSWNMQFAMLILHCSCPQCTLAQAYNKSNSAVR